MTPRARVEKMVKYQAKLLWFQAFTGWEPALYEEQEAEVYKVTDVEARDTMLREALHTLIVELQSGAATLYREKALLIRDHDWILSQAQKAQNLLAALRGERT